VAPDGYVFNGMLWPHAARFEAWDLPRDFVSLRPLNELAEKIADYSQRVTLHHLARPVRAVDGFLPAMSPTICSGVPGNGRRSPRVRDDLDSRSSAFVAMAAGSKAPPARKEPANYWFDRRHVEQFELRVQSFRTVADELA
jgi:hypothetical protein